MYVDFICQECLVPCVLKILTLTPVTHLRDWPCDFLNIAPYKDCQGVSHLEKMFQDIINEGGEGIILRNPCDPYNPGRSPGYLKHKVLLYFTCYYDFSDIATRDSVIPRQCWSKRWEDTNGSASCKYKHSPITHALLTLLQSKWCDIRGSSRDDTVR